MVQLKVRLKAEVVEALLRGCVPWSPSKTHYIYYDKTTAPVSSNSLAGETGGAMITLCPMPPPDSPRLGARTLNIETTVYHRRRVLFAGGATRMGDEKVLKKEMFGELVGGKSYSLLPAPPYNIFFLHMYSVQK